MLKVLSYILCDLDPKVKVIGQKAGICDGVPSTSALVVIMMIIILVIMQIMILLLVMMRIILIITNNTIVICIRILE